MSKVKVPSNGYFLTCTACVETRLRPFEQVEGLCSTCKRLVRSAANRVEDDNMYVKNQMYKNYLGGSEDFGIDPEDAENEYQGYD